MLSGTVTDREIEMVDNDDVGFTEERYVTAESNFRDWYPPRGAGVERCRHRGTDRT